MSKGLWREYQITDIASTQRWALNGGPFGSKLVSSMYVSAGVPVIRGCNLPFDRRFDESDFVFVTEEKAEELRQHAALRGDLVITQRGTLGQVGLIPPDSAYPRYIVSQSQMKLTVDQSKADPLFVYYFFRSPGTVRRIEDLALRAGVPHINLAILRSFPISLPDLHLQRRIASILGAYDDLIEVNRRRIALLEEMARRLFEEWFVHFRFPGHEDVPLVSIGDARLPEGWQQKPLAAVAAVNGDTIKPAKAQGRIGYIDISSVSVGTVEKVEWMEFAEAPGRARRRVKDGSIIWSMVRPNRCSYALLLDPEPDTIASTGFAVLDAQSLPFAYLFHAVTTDEFVGYLTGNATGAAYPAVTGAVFERASIVVPPSALAVRFAEAAEPMLRSASKLRATNARLAASRDLLLPRLISGELSVTAAERDLETAA